MLVANELGLVCAVAAVAGYDAWDTHWLVPVQPSSSLVGWRCMRQYARSVQC